MPESYVEINPATAAKLGINDGDKVKVTSRRGTIVVKAKVSDIVEDSVVFIPFHFAEGAANILTMQLWIQSVRYLNTRYVQ